ncbi:MAG TPA: hypothetical protein VNH13_05235 [Candidatus Acidoferrales bacterium]|nr:hypothetical protein [Candidatus Acidoferrales bacterium]
MSRWTGSGSRRRAASVGIAMLILAGCGSAGPSVAAGTAPASPSAAPTTAPSATAGVLASPSPSRIVTRAALKVVRRLTLDLTAAQTAGEIGSTDFRAYEPLLVILRLSLDDGSISLSEVNYAALGKQVTADAAKLQGVHGQAVVADYDLLGSVLAAKPFVAGPLSAGSWFTTSFQPTLVVTVPTGWTAAPETEATIHLSKLGATLEIGTAAGPSASGTISVDLDGTTVFLTAGGPAAAMTSLGPEIQAIAASLVRS